jgi:hypothetical protein
MNVERRTLNVLPVFSLSVGIRIQTSDKGPLGERDVGESRNSGKPDGETQSLHQ